MHVSHKRSLNTFCDSTQNLEFGWSSHAGFNVETCENENHDSHQVKKNKLLTCNLSPKKISQTLLAPPIKLKTQTGDSSLKINREILVEFLKYLPKSRRRHHSLIGSFYGNFKEVLFSLEDMYYITEGAKHDLIEELEKQYHKNLLEKLEEQERNYRFITEEIIENKLKNSTFDYMS